MKTQNLLTTFIAIVLMLAPSALALDVQFDRVELNDQELSVNSVNRLDVQRDGKVDVEVRFTPTNNVKNVEIEASIRGYEHNQDSRIVDVTPLFDADANVTYVKKLQLSLPDNVEEDNYLLRVVATDRDTTPVVQEFRLKLDVPRHMLKVEDMLVHPGTTLKGGETALVTVRLENLGEKDEEDVKVTASIPELKVSASDFIDEIENEDEEETEEMLLRIPKCAEEGVYTLKVQASYDEDRMTASQERSIVVTRNPSCDEKAQPTVVVQQPTAPAPEPTPAVPASSKLRRALEIVLIGLLVLLVIIGLIIGFAKLSSDE